MGPVHPESLQIWRFTNSNKVNRSSSPSRKLFKILTFKLTTKPFCSRRKALWIKPKNKFIVSWSKCEIMSKKRELDFMHYISIGSDFKQTTGIGDKNPFTINSHLFKKKSEVITSVLASSYKSTQFYSWNIFWFDKHLKTQLNLDINNFASWRFLLLLKTYRSTWLSSCRITQTTLPTFSYISALFEHHMFTD